jgi:hypothetical protein
MAPGHDFDTDDPMELAAMEVDGDPDVMAACIVDEFVRMGLGDEELLRMFERPFFAGAHAVYRARGAAHVQRLIAEARARWGQPRFTVRETPDLLDIAPPAGKED